MRKYQRTKITDLENPKADDQHTLNADMNNSYCDFMYQALLARRHKEIKQAAYFKAEHRGFAPGHELDDWLEAEKEIDDASYPLAPSI